MVGGYCMNHLKKVNWVLWTILFANIFVALIKILFGQIIKSSSMTADGFHSFTDGASNIIGLIGIHLASKPKDEDHPYGHKKFENLAGLFIAIMLLVIGLKMIVEAFQRFINPVPLKITFQSLLMLIITLIINIIIAHYEYQQGKKINSTILISDSIHTKSDIFISLGVLVTLISIKLGLPYFIDSFTSLVVSILILHASYEISQATCGPLLDQAIIDANKIQEVVLSFDEVKDVHDIKSRGTRDEIYIDFHIVIEPTISFIESHELTDSIEKKLKSTFYENMEINIRTEPFPSMEV